VETVKENPSGGRVPPQGNESMRNRPLRFFLFRQTSLGRERCIDAATKRNPGILESMFQT
jgi:hypothetical protein